MDALNEYNEQLQRVNEALTVAENEEDRNNLLSLKNDLQQLIALAGEDETACKNTQIEKNQAIVDEYALFMAEMQKEGAIESSQPTELQSSGESTLKLDLMTLEGMKCKAPHSHTWGDTIHHNALITSVISQSSDSYDNLKVKVLFINPTHKEMLPCPYYLETECKFSDEKCRYSHGETVLFSTLEEYVEPDFDGLIIGSFVLVKQNDKLWHRGTVRRILKDLGRVIVKLEKNKEEVEVDFVDLYPMDDSNEDSCDDSSDSESAIDEESRQDLINISMLMTPSDDKLGSWEKHTKGIGSKLMEKMGYVIGTGLGKRGEGRVEPVTAVALPAGKSLDHCMELREKSGGDKNLFNVERKLKRLARKQEARNVKNYERESKKVDVFNFINDKLKVDRSGEDIQLSKSQHRKEIKQETNRNLNVESFKIEQRIKEIQGDMLKIRQAMQRHSASPGTSLHKQLKNKYRVKEEELQTFQNKAQNIKMEQSVRDTTRKLTVF